MPRSWDVSPTISRSRAGSANSAISSWSIAGSGFGRAARRHELAPEPGDLERVVEPAPALARRHREPVAAPAERVEQLAHAREEDHRVLLGEEMPAVEIGRA